MACIPADLVEFLPLPVHIHTPQVFAVHSDYWTSLSQMIQYQMLEQHYMNSGRDVMELNFFKSL